MTDLSRGTRARRSGRRPGWLLLTVLLVLAIGASSALVFTSRVELLKLAVILALWAAVVAAFVSVIYRRQSDIDQAKVRDLKLVYDLQLDREISARREYELTVETQLRRELTSEIRAQAADEVAGCGPSWPRCAPIWRFCSTPTCRTGPRSKPIASRAYSDWPRGAESTGRVTASRIDTEDGEDLDANTEESPIIDVPAEPHPSEAEWVPPPSSVVRTAGRRRPSRRSGPSRRGAAARVGATASQPPPQPVAQPAPEPQFAWQPPQQERRATCSDLPAACASRRPEPEPRRAGSGVAARARRGTSGYPRARRAATGCRPRRPIRRLSRRARTAPPANTSAGRRAARAGDAVPARRIRRRGRHSAPPDAVDPGRPPAPPTLAAESGGPPPHPEPEPEPPPAQPEARRHRSAEDTGGQSVAELLARLQATPTGGGRRSRREE